MVGTPEGQLSGSARGNAQLLRERLLCGHNCLASKRGSAERSGSVWYGESE